MISQNVIFRGFHVCWLGLTGDWFCRERRFLFLNEPLMSRRYSSSSLQVQIHEHSTGKYTVFKNTNTKANLFDTDNSCFWMSPWSATPPLPGLSQVPPLTYVGEPDYQVAACANTRRGKYTLFTNTKANLFETDNFCFQWVLDESSCYHRFDQIAHVRQQWKSSQ